jgi:hypothetical protein
VHDGSWPTFGSDRRVKVQTKECAMNAMVTTLLRRSLMTLSAITIWAKTLARGRADPVNAEDQSKVQQKSNP